ncbi:MAG: hypothetical protein V4787_01655 [Pseudomonadota bacterium]
MARPLTAVDFRLAKSNPAKVFWFGDLLDTLDAKDLQELVRSATYSSQALAHGAISALVARISLHLRSHNPALFVTYMDAKRRLYRRPHAATHDLGEFGLSLQRVLQELCVGHQRKLLSATSLDLQWTREFLASAVAQALANITPAQGPNGTAREVVFAAYPFLDDDGDNEAMRLFGIARYNAIKCKALDVLYSPAYRAALNDAIDYVIQDAPPGRQIVWAQCLAAARRKTHPLALAESLGFSFDESGRNRAKVALTRMGRRLHDRYFQILCARQMMTPVISEFMALQYRVPREIVRAGLHGIRMANSHAVSYARPAATGPGGQPGSSFIAFQKSQEGNNADR